MTRERADIVKMIKSMEYIATHINNEGILLDEWRTFGIPEGCIDPGDLYDNPDGIEFFVDNDNNFAELMGLFLECMKHAGDDYGLYCNDVVSK